MKTSMLCATLLAVSSSPLLAQTAGLPPGEILNYNPIATSFATDGGAIQRLDPLTGQVSVLQALAESLFRPGVMCVDAYRDRVVFYGRPAATGGFMRLWSLHAGGQIEDLGFETETLYLLTPGAGGKIYLHDESPSGLFAPLRYLDAQNVRYDVLDAAGAQPFTYPSFVNTTALGYDPDLHALLVAIPSQDSFGAVLCPGGDALRVTILRLDLSADGTRVMGTACTQIPIDPFGSNLPLGLSRMDDGDWLLGIDTNSNESQPRMQRIDPATLACTPFAFNGPYTGAAVTDTVCWSSSRGEALLADNSNVRLWSFADGGSGALVPTSQPLVFGGLYGFWQTMVEVPEPGCADSIGFYCTPKTTAAGCVPALSSTGAPSASAASGFVVRATQVVPGMFGLLFYGTSGAASITFQGGLLCVQPPLIRTGIQIAGGAGACGGTYALDFSAQVAAGSDPSLVAGATVCAQYWFRDPAEPLYGSGLTGGIRFTLCP